MIEEYFDIEMINEICDETLNQLGRWGNIYMIHIYEFA